MASRSHFTMYFIILNIATISTTTNRNTEERTSLAWIRPPDLPLCQPHFLQLSSLIDSRESPLISHHSTNNGYFPHLYFQYSIWNKSNSLLFTPNSPASLALFNNELTSITCSTYMHCGSLNIRSPLPCNSHNQRQLNQYSRLVHTRGSLHLHITLIDTQEWSLSPLTFGIHTSGTVAGTQPTSHFINIIRLLERAAADAYQTIRVRPHFLHLYNRFHLPSNSVNTDMAINKGFILLKAFGISVTTPLHRHQPPLSVNKSYSNLSSYQGCCNLCR